nr:transglycosylase SLT domain-containing protein [Arenicellales bacterium]
MRFQSLFACFIVAQLWFVAPVFAAEIYIYERADGSRLITDHARIEPGYELVKVYPTVADESPSFRASQSLSARHTTEYDDLIKRVSNAVTLDPALIKSVMQAESAFNPRALSKKGARGLMQLMPGTARKYGVTQIL